MAQADELAALSRAVWRLYLDRRPMLGGSGGGSVPRLEKWRYQRFGMGADGLGKLAKLCGATPEQVSGWMNGTITPTTGQFVALLRALEGGPGAGDDDAGE